LYDRYNDWNDWEFDWLSDEVRRPSDYLYSEKERAVLERLQHYSRSFSEYAGYTVPELAAIAYASRLDFDQQDLRRRMMFAGDKPASISRASSVSSA
jgi:hypothetical protein